jgi:alpha-N-arabinofuranosidase
VARLIRNGGISMLRWPGGNFASDYFWHEGIGPIDRRPTRLNRARPELEPHDLGTDEFLAFCRDYEIEPFIVLNAGSGSIEDAAAWVEYCNGPADSESGRRRAENGHPEPWAVRYWSLGNELWGNFQVGHVDAETYAHRADETAQAMRAVDPDIHITAIGHIRDTTGGWNRHVARAVGDSVDAIAIHHYPVIISTVDHPPPDDAMWDAITAGANDAADILSDSIAVIDAHWSGDTPPEISFDEWNSWVGVHGHAGWLEEPFRLRDGLYAAALFNEIHRRAERITMAHQAMIVNRLGFIEVRPTRTWLTASFQALALYAEHSGTIALATNYAGPTFNTRAFGGAPPQADVPALNVMATATVDGRRIVVAGVNLQAEGDIAARIEIAGSAIAATATVRELNGDDGMAYDTFEDPGRTRVTAREVDLDPKDGAFDYVFPAHSATLIELTISG